MQALDDQCAGQHDHHDDHAAAQEPVRVQGRVPIRWVGHGSSMSGAYRHIGLCGQRQPRQPEPRGDQFRDAGVSTERLGDHVGTAGAQPVLKQPVGQQIRRHSHSAGARERRSATTSPIQCVPLTA